jgi:uroporphyrinogen-III decarboxylase
MLRVFLPRVSGVMQPLKQLRPLHECFSYYLGIGPNVARLPLPDIESALEKLKEAGKIAVELNRPIESFENFALSMGFPIFHGGGTAAPYDVIGDFIRGTRGVMLDMYRRPDKLLAAMNKMVPYLIDMGLQAKDRRSCFVGIPLHKHSEGFMSQEQFKNFFWPSLKKVMLGLIEEGLVPVPFFEGETTSRLEVIRDIPPGKAIYHFQNVNLYKARDALAGVVCFQGNVPASLLCTGTPEQVELYVKDLIDIFGRSGGLILNSGSVMDTARYENVKAMFETTRKYGVYK